MQNFSQQSFGYTIKKGSSKIATDHLKERRFPWNPTTFQGVIWVLKGIGSTVSLSRPDQNFCTDMHESQRGLIVTLCKTVSVNFSYWLLFFNCSCSERTIDLQAFLAVLDTRCELDSSGEVCRRTCHAIGRSDGSCVGAEVTENQIW